MRWPEERRLLATPEVLSAVSNDVCRCGHGISSITAQTRRQVAIEAAAYVRNARTYFDQARATTEAVRPVLYYYGGLSFLDFVASFLIHRDGSGGGLAPVW